MDRQMSGAIATEMMVLEWPGNGIRSVTTGRGWAGFRCAGTRRIHPAQAPVGQFTECRLPCVLGPEPPVISRRLGGKRFVDAGYGTVKRACVAGSFHVYAMIWSEIPTEG